LREMLLFGQKRLDLATKFFPRFILVSSLYPNFTMKLIHFSL